MPEEELFVDEPCVISFFIAEMGWLLQRWQGYLRYLKQKVYPDHKFVMMMNLQFHVFVDDFIAYTLDLPKEFYDLGLETDCYEAPLAGSRPGSLTPPNVYAAIIEVLRNFYNREKAIEIWPPRGCNLWIDKRPQLFKRYTASPIKSDKPIMVIFPRKRLRTPQRNVPEFIWREVVEHLKQDFTIVLGGTPNGTGLVDYEDDVINLIRYDDEDKLEKIVQYLNSAVCSLSSQSGLTHISLLSGCPSYIIGHEKQRHAIDENRLNIPVTFRQVADYRAIDAETIVKDVKGLLSVLERMNFNSRDRRINRPSLRTLQERKDLVGAEIGTWMGTNALNILENLDIERLYLIDPYRPYSSLERAKGSETVEDYVKARSLARQVLSKYEDKIVWIEKLSNDAISEIKDDLDFVYIDGNHAYDYIKEDLRLYYPKVKDGGLIAGHDYDEETESNGVKRAVNEFFEKRNIEVFSAVSMDDKRSNDWWCFKPSSISDVIEGDIEILNKLIKRN